MTVTIDFSKDDDPEWFKWWVNPVTNGSPEPDPEDLKETQEYIARNFTPEVQAAIEIHVRPRQED